jgi:hypothetical protein
MRTGRSVRATVAASPEVFSRLRRQPTPETRLLIAIVEEAINCFQRYCFAEHDLGQRLFREADEWLMSNHRDWAFSFESICDAIGLEPSYVRYGLRQWRARQLRTGGRDTSVPGECPTFSRPTF